MERKTLTLILALITLTVNAQQKSGTFTVTPKVGFTISNFSGEMPAGIAYVIIPDGHYTSTGTTELQPVDQNKYVRAGAMYFGDIKNKVGIEGNSSAHNRVLTFTLGYKFP